jgi:hypothetical protein
VNIKQDPRFKQLCADVWACWQSIGHDVEQACAEMDERLTNEMAVESCLDADRMRMYPGGLNGAASADFVREMASAGHYRDLKRAVMRECRLA